MSPSSWTDRIPFVCLFAIRTSVELFQEKLPQKMIRRLQGREFDVAQTDYNGLFRAVSSPSDHRLSWLGPGVSNLILQAQEVSGQSVSFFTMSLQVCTAARSIAEPKLMMFSTHT